MLCAGVTQCDKAAHCLHCSLDRALAFCVWTASMNEWTDGRHLMPRETVVLATSQRTTDQALRPNSCQASAGLHRTVRVTSGRYVHHCVEKPRGIGKKFPTLMERRSSHRLISAS